MEKDNKKNNGEKWVIMSVEQFRTTLAMTTLGLGKYYLYIFLQIDK